MPILPWMPSITSGIGAIGSAITGDKAARDARIGQSKAQWRQAQINREAWNAQNKYNTPSAQMQRYKDAGLNPALMYGQGNPGNASGAPQVQKSDPQFTDYKDSWQQVGQSGMQMYQAQMMQKQMDLTDSAIEKNKKETLIKAIQAAKDAGMLNSQVRSAYQKTLMNSLAIDAQGTQNKGYVLDNKSKLLSIEGAKTDNQKKRHDRDLAKAKSLMSNHEFGIMKKNGLTSYDSPYYKLVVRLINTGSMSAMQAIKAVLEMSTGREVPNLNDGQIINRQ